MIYVDKREKTPWMLTNAWAGVAVTAATLKTADYSNGTVLVERKAVGDFINCCGKSKTRFMAEVDRGFDYLIIEGNRDALAAYLKKRHSRMTIKYIDKVINEIKARGIVVILSDNREAAAKTALEILAA
ncbi:MAG: hypothetical protein PHT13_00285 [Methanosarcina sp.]|nr:hypothetical protein [Methanosarcina sp.]